MGSKVVLAYSGGLDTSVILQVLKDRGHEVVAYIADVGQGDDFAALEKRALATGAIKAVVHDLKREFVTDYVFPAIAGNAVYEGRYLLGTSLARPVIAKGQVEVALAEGADTVSHGATGKGNDQVRFELGYAALAPKLKCYAPWKDPEFLARFKGRSDLIRYAEERKIPIEVTAQKPYSSDANLMHTSYEAGLLEDPSKAPSEDMFQRTRAIEQTPDVGCRLELQFRDAYPTAVINRDDGTRHTDALALFEYLNAVAGEHGVGRIDIVENRFVGIKSRGVYETPGGTVLHAAVRDLEGLTVDREVLRLRNGLSQRFAELIYNGFWFSPEMDFLRAAFRSAEQRVTGSVFVRLFKGNVIVEGRASEHSLYDQDLSSMDIEGGYDQSDARGFIRIHGVRLRAHHIHRGRPA